MLYRALKREAAQKWNSWASCSGAGGPTAAPAGGVGSLCGVKERSTASASAGDARALCDALC